MYISAESFFRAAKKKFVCVKTCICVGQLDIAAGSHYTDRRKPVSFYI